MFYNFSVKNKLFIFDLDGTLVNTVVDLNAAINHGLKNNNFPTVSVEYTAKAIGNGIAITIWRSLPEGTSEEAHKRVLSDFRKYYREHYLDNSKPYPEMVETLTLLKNRGYLLAVATNKLDEIATKMINALFPNIFDLIQGDLPEFPKKPDPYLLNKVINKLGVDKSDVVYVGDSEVDIETAINAGVKLILVDYGYHRTEKFLKDSRGLHIKSPKELLDK